MLLCLIGIKSLHLVEHLDWKQETEGRYSSFEITHPNSTIIHMNEGVLMSTLTSFISPHSVQPLCLLMCHCFYCRWNEDREAAALSARCYSAVCLLHWHASLHMCFYFLLNHEEHKHTFSLDWKLNYSVNNGIQTDGPKKSSLICLYFSLSGVF